MDQSLHPEGIMAPSHDCLGIQGLQLPRAAFEDAVILQEFILALAKDNLPLMNQGDVVRDAFQVANYMGGHEDGIAFILNEIHKHILNLVSNNGIKAAGGFIQNEEAGVVG